MFFTLNRFLMVYFITDNNGYIILGKYQFSLVTQSYLTLCNPIYHSTPGLPVHHQLLEFTQSHVHWVGDAISHLILCCPLLLLPPIPPASESFPMIQLFTWGGQSTGVSALVCLPPTIYFPSITIQLLPLPISPSPIPFPLTTPDLFSVSMCLF